MVLIALRVKPEAQALVRAPHPVDQWTVTASDGTRLQLYFNPKLHFERLERRLREVRAAGKPALTVHDGAPAPIPATR